MHFSLKEISTLEESIKHGDDTTMSTTIDENPLLVRQGNMVQGGDKVNAEKANQKKIRRDSNTGFEKFEDYFDSDADNTTLKGNNITTSNDSREDKSKSTFDINLAFPCDSGMI